MSIRTNDDNSEGVSARPGPTLPSHTVTSATAAATNDTSTPDQSSMSSANNSVESSGQDSSRKDARCTENVKAKSTVNRQDVVKDRLLQIAEEQHLKRMKIMNLEEEILHLQKQKLLREMGIENAPPETDTADESTSMANSNAVGGTATSCTSVHPQMLSESIVWRPCQI